MEAVIVEVVIIQRIVPHYRIPLFERLYEEFGWCVAAAKNSPAGLNMSMAEDKPFLLPFDMKFRGSANPFQTIVPVRQILRSTGAKAVIAEFSLSMSSTYELALRRRLFGSPRLLFWSHGYNMKFGLHGYRAAARNRLRVPLIRSVDAYVCYSHEGASFVSRYLDSSKVFVCRNTLATGSETGSTRRLEKRAGEIRLLFVGRMTRERDLPMLVHVFRRLRDNLPNAVLTLVGRGPEEEKVRAAAGGLLGNAIFMPGMIYDESVLANYYAAADLFVITGAAGLSVNHALSYGVPVVLFERSESGPGHGPEHIYVQPGKTGWRVSPHTEEAMLASITDIFSKHPDPRGLLAGSLKQYVEDELTLEGMVDDFRQVRAYLQKIGVNNA